MKNIYALVDCNNFYISCERIFDPSLWKRPVVVLSNNDGNVVARSDEVKKMGMPFGAPFFKLKKLIKKHNIAVFSSNYALYGDISRRVMDSLAQFSENMEIYSIDEAFLSFKDEPQYSNAGACRLPAPSSYTPALIACATGLLEKIYRTGYRYKKTGVMLTDIIPELDAQPCLFSPFRENSRNRSIMEAVDKINRSMGRQTVRFAAEGIQKPWDMRRQFLSKKYTTNWDEIPVVRA